MKKETIRISDYETEEYYTDWKQLVYIDETTTCIDLDRGYTDTEVVVQRITDRKFFMFNTRTYENSNDALEQVATEVERKERLTYYYE